MTTKQQIKYRVIQKLCHFHNGIFHPIQLCQFYSSTFPVPFTKLKKSQNRRTEDSLHIWLLQRILLYKWRQKITSLNTIEFSDTYVFMNNPHWRNSGILTFLSKYYIVISDTLVGSFLDVFFLLLAVILSERFERPRRKD